MNPLLHPVLHPVFRPEHHLPPIEAREMTDSTKRIQGIALSIITAIVTIPFFPLPVALAISIGVGLVAYHRPGIFFLQRQMTYHPMDRVQERGAGRERLSSLWAALRFRYLPSRFGVDHEPVGRGGRHGSMTNSLSSRRPDERLQGGHQSRQQEAVNREEWVRSSPPVRRPIQEERVGNSPLVRNMEREILGQLRRLGQEARETGLNPLRREREIVGDGRLPRQEEQAGISPSIRDTEREPVGHLRRPGQEARGTDLDPLRSEREIVGEGRGGHVRLPSIPDREERASVASRSSISQGSEREPVGPRRTRHI